MKRLISIVIAMLLSAAMFAQSVPQTVNFSATVRDASNQLLSNSPITVRLTIYEGGEGGTPVYCAMHQTTTNANGFMSFQLNRDVYAYCSDVTNTQFDEIPWGNGNYWMYVEYQAQIGGPFESLGYLEITSGFYAFAADRALVAQKLEGFDIDVTNAQDGDILVYNGTTRKWEARRPNNSGQTTAQTPTVSTSTATNITAAGATLAGNVASDGGASVTARGFMYGTSASNLSQTVQSGSGIGSFTADLAGLTSGTTYYYKAYATNSEGTGYGEVMSFTTIGSMNYTEGNFQWERMGGQAGTGLDEFGLEWRMNNTRGVYAYIEPLEGAGLYILSSSDYAIQDVNTLNARLTSETETTVYRGVNVEYASHSYDDVIATVYNGKTYLIHVTNSVAQPETAGTHFTITGTYKVWESGSTASASYSDPTGYTNGYGYVDLGLPSGTKWATCNVGASTPTAYGNYYAWGETTTKSSYTEDNYTYSSNPTTLPSSADAATANWGSGWRMPTKTEMQELVDNCTVTWTTQNGVNGCLFTGPNGNSIFLPAAGCRNDSSLYDAGSIGYYWSSSLYSSNTYRAWYLDFTSGYCNMRSYYRCSGLSVRAVCQSQD